MRLAACLLIASSVALADGAAQGGLKSLGAPGQSGTNTGDVTIAAPGAATANGLSISGQALSATPADATNPGILTSGVQTIGGAKTFSASMVVSGSISPSAGLSVSGSDVTVGASNVASTINYDADGPTALAWSTDTGSAWVNASAKIHSFKVNGVEKASISVTGKGVFASGTTVGGSVVVTSADWTLTAYDPVTLTGTTGNIYQVGPITNAGTLRDITFVAPIAGGGTGTETIKLSTASGCGSAVLGTLSIACNGAANAITTGTVNSSALAAASTLWVCITGACTTADIQGNISAHFTTP